MRIELRHGDCIEVLAGLPDGSLRAVVSDPPYGIGFMGKEWDDFGRIKQYERQAKGVERMHAAVQFEAFNVAWLRQCFRALKSGGICRAFSATRMYHRVASAMEQVGFTDIGLVAWGYGSGFPKNLDMSKFIATKARTTVTKNLRSRLKNKDKVGKDGAGRPFWLGTLGSLVQFPSLCFC